MRKRFPQAKIIPLQAFSSKSKRWAPCYPQALEAIRIRSQLWIQRTEKPPLRMKWSHSDRMKYSTQIFLDFPRRESESKRRPESAS